MARITDYPAETTPENSDVMLLDGEKGTRTIAYEDLKNDIVSDVPVPDPEIDIEKYPAADVPIAEDLLFLDGTNGPRKITYENLESSVQKELRDLITDLTTRLNALADSDDTTLDQLSEIVAYIKSNRELIDSITTSKVSVSSIVDDLITEATDKPLSANQGKVLREKIEAVLSEIPEADLDIDKYPAETTPVAEDLLFLDGAKGPRKITYQTLLNSLPSSDGSGTSTPSEGLVIKTIGTGLKLENNILLSLIASSIGTSDWIVSGNINYGSGERWYEFNAFPISNDEYKMAIVSASCIYTGNRIAYGVWLIFACVINGVKYYDKNQLILFKSDTSANTVLDLRLEDAQYGVFKFMLRENNSTKPLDDGGHFKMKKLL